MTTNNDDFWGNHDDWPEAPEGARREPRPGVGSTVSRWWNNMLGGGSTGNRAHGGRYSTTAPVDLEDEPLSINPSGEHPVVRPSGEVPVTRTTPTPSKRDEPKRADRTGGAVRPTNNVPPAPIDDAWDDDWEVTIDQAPATPKPGVDPLLARLGGAAIVLTLMVPLFLGVGSGDDEPAANAAIIDPMITLLAPSADASVVETAPITPATADASTETAVATPAAPAAAPTVATTVAAPQSTSQSATAADQAPATTQVIDTGAVASTTAERVQSCAIDYTVVAGDFWLRLADEAGVPIEQILDANDATSDTPLYPGSTVCLPQGSAMPSPPTTQAPATTAKPTTTTPATTAPVANTAATVKPVVTSPTPSAAAVQQIIRDVWPDELEDRAIEIADRESNFVATAQNSCCYGIFQMHWGAHKGWLAGLGITSPDQLFDVTDNAYVAYALYQRSGGWGPWT